jgi:small subunit ribosomal protein S17
MVYRGQRKDRVGIVISDKMNKGIVVRLTRTTKHPVYKRVIKKSKNIMAHDEKNEAKVGDKVRLQETRPLSKSKRWRLVEVLKTQKRKNLKT